MLCPRAKAVRDSLSTLGASLDAVYHVTIAYSSTFREDSTTGVQRLPAPSMSDILMGDNPRVHVHLKRIPVTGKITYRRGRERWHTVEEWEDGILLRKKEMAYCRGRGRWRVVEEREDSTWSRKGKMVYGRGKGRWYMVEEGEDGI